MTVCVITIRQYSPPNNSQLLPIVPYMGAASSFRECFFISRLHFPHRKYIRVHCILLSLNSDQHCLYTHQYSPTFPTIANSALDGSSFFISRELLHFERASSSWQIYACSLHHYYIVITTSVVTTPTYYHDWRIKVLFSLKWVHFL